MATKNLSLLLFLFAFFFSCTDDHVVSEKNDSENINDGNHILEDHINPQDCKSKNGGASARVDVTGGNLTLIIDTPVDASGNVIVSSSGTTQVNFRVIIRRSSTTANVHLQFQIRNSIQSVFWTSPVIRTLDFPNSQLEKTVTGSFNVTASSINQGNYDLCLFTRDFIAGLDFTGDCKNAIVFTMPVPNNVFANHDGVEELTVTWDPVQGASEYKIYTYIDEPGRPVEPRYYRTTTTNQWVRELKLQYRESYRIWVSARNSNGIESALREANYSWK